VKFLDDSSNVGTEVEHLTARSAHADDKSYGVLFSCRPSSMIKIENMAPPTKNNRIEKSKRKGKKKQRLWRHITSKAPTSASCEIPIIVALLERGSGFRLPAKKVIEELTTTSRERWFPELNEDDLQARHPNSKRKIVEIAIRFARKNLELREELYPPSDKHPAGTWEVAMKGKMRLGGWRVRGEGSWRAKYSVHTDAIIPVETAEEVESS